MTIDLAPYITEGLPKYIAIANALSEAIRVTPLHAGTKLPTHRILAEQLNVSVQTVSAAYALAEKMQVVQARVGSGTYVSDDLGTKEAEFLNANETEDSNRGIDLSIARAVCTPQHVQVIQQAMGKLCASPSDEYIRTCRPISGLQHHREAARNWLKTQKLICDNNQIALCNGAAHGIFLALSTVVQPGDTVLCEAITDHGLIALSRTLHFKLQGLPIDQNGIIPAALEQACQDKKFAALCCTPTMNNPTTDTMDWQRRTAIAEIAEQHNLFVIEDDVYGALPPDRIPPLSSLLPNQSFYVTSFTKTVAAGLRAGYLVMPKHLINLTLPRLRATTWMATPLVFEIVSILVNDGDADRLISWQRNELAARQVLAAKILAGFNFKAHPYGMHIWLEAPEDWRPHEIIIEAKQQGVLVTPADAYTVGREPSPHCVRISLGAEDSRDRLEKGLSLLAKLLTRSPQPMNIAL